VVVISPVSDGIHFHMSPLTSRARPAKLLRIKQTLNQSNGGRQPCHDLVRVRFDWDDHDCDCDDETLVEHEYEYEIRSTKFSATDYGPVQSQERYILFASEIGLPKLPRTLSIIYFANSRL
jgi:hypothetical protein